MFYKIKSPVKLLITVLILLLFLLTLFFVQSIIFENKLDCDDIYIVPLSVHDKKSLKKYDNGYHLKTAKQNGLKTPIKTKKEFENIDNKSLSNNNMVNLSNSKHYNIQRLTHSYPYAHKDVRVFLNTLAERFNKTLKSKNIKHYKFYLTSVLRTEDSQKELTKVNLNATKNETAHLYGRTIDISKTQFYDVSEDKIVYSNNIGTLLIRELLKLQEEGLCFVLLENKNHCLHITVR